MKNPAQFGTVFKKYFGRCAVLVAAFCFLSLNIFPAFAQENSSFNLENTTTNNSSNSSLNLQNTQTNNSSISNFGTENTNTTQSFTQQTTAPTGNNGQGTQGSNAVNGNTAGTLNLTSANETAATNVGICITSAYAVKLAKDAITEAWVAAKGTKVSTTDQTVNSTAGEVGQLGYDAAAYCVINGIIEYIANATIAWINSGFNGNPAFVEDPEKFFTDIGDTVAAGFIQELVATSTGINICQPFRLNLAVNLDSGYSKNNFKSKSQCSLGTIENNFNDFTSGGTSAGSWGNWLTVTQNNQNNPYGAQLLANKELNERISIKKNTANIDLTAGRGFLSFKECEPDTVNKDNGQTVKGPCKTKTPGSVIENTLNTRLNSGTNRLVLADKFDQVVSSLVNALIKIALNEVLSSGTSTQ